MKRETRSRRARRASGIAAWSACNSEDRPSPLTLQESRILHRFRMSPALAAIVAELAFSTREAVR